MAGDCGLVAVWRQEQRGRLGVIRKHFGRVKTAMNKHLSKPAAWAKPAGYG